VFSIGLALISFERLTKGDMPEFRPSLMRLDRFESKVFCQTHVSLKLRLSAAGLTNIPVQDAFEPFTFLVDGHCFPSHVAQAHSTDVTLSEYQIMTPVSSHSFGQFLSLADGSSVSITASNCIGFLRLGQELDNPGFAHSCSAMRPQFWKRTSSQALTSQPQLF
jgi:hypothetical protein